MGSFTMSSNFKYNLDCNCEILCFEDGKSN